MTLVDLWADTLARSQRINPACEPHLSDMRTIRFAAGGHFDRVFNQDAIFYMATPEELSSAMGTAYYQCRPGGAPLPAPEYVAESFQPGTETDGRDEPGRGMRCPAWRWDPDPSDHTYQMDFAFLLREPSDSVRVEHDRYAGRLFPRAGWLRVLRQAGLVPSNLNFLHSDMNLPLDLFVSGPRKIRPSSGTGWR